MYKGSLQVPFYQLGAAGRRATPYPISLWLEGASGGLGGGTGDRDDCCDIHAEMGGWRAKSCSSGWRRRRRICAVAVFGSGVLVFFLATMQGS